MSNIRTVVIAVTAVLAAVAVMVTGALWAINHHLHSDHRKQLQPTALAEYLQRQDTLRVHSRGLSFDIEADADLVCNVLDAENWTVKRRVTHATHDTAIDVTFFSDGRIAVYENDTAQATYMITTVSYRLPEGTYSRLRQFCEC